MVQTLSYKMTESWGGVCSTLTIVNPVLLLHAGNFSGDSVVSVFTTHRTWAFGGDGIPAELFQIPKDDAVEVLHSI